MNLEFELARLAEMKVTELREKFREVFGEETRSGNRQWLVKRIAWKIQANALGGLSERAKRRATELAQDADVRLLPPRTLKLPALAPRANVVGLAVGSELTRVYKGRKLVVRVESDGFVYEGTKFRTFTALTKHITGSHQSGNAFFRTRKPK